MDILLMNIDLIAKKGPHPQLILEQVKIWINIEDMARDCFYVFVFASVLHLGKFVKREREGSESWKDFLKSLIVQFSNLSFSSLSKGCAVAIGVPKLLLEPPSEIAVRVVNPRPVNACDSDLSTEAKDGGHCSHQPAPVPFRTMQVVLARKSTDNPKWQVIQPCLPCPFSWWF